MRAFSVEIKHLLACFCGFALAGALGRSRKAPLMRSWWLVGQFARRDVARDARRARSEKGGLRLRGGEGGWGAFSRDSFRLERGVEEGNDCNADDPFGSAQGRLRLAEITQMLSSAPAGRWGARMGAPECKGEEAGNGYNADCR
jgi:hypothetical protein